MEWNSGEFCSGAACAGDVLENSKNHRISRDLECLDELELRITTVLSQADVNSTFSKCKKNRVSEVWAADCCSESKRLRCLEFLEHSSAGRSLT